MSAQQQSPAATAKANVIVDRFKTRPCRNFTTHGACPYEERCMFAHGDEELRTREMNIQQGITTDEAVRAFQRNLRFQRQQRQMPQNRAESKPAANRVAETEPTSTVPSSPLSKHGSEIDASNNTGAADRPSENEKTAQQKRHDPSSQQQQRPKVRQHQPYACQVIQYDGPAPQQYYDNTCFCHDCNQARKAAGFYATYNYNGNASAPCMCDECLTAQTDSSLANTFSHIRVSTSVPSSELRPIKNGGPRAFAP